MDFLGFGDDWANVRPSVVNAILITITVIITLNLLKFAMSRWPVPGLAPLVFNT